MYCERRKISSKLLPGDRSCCLQTELKNGSDINKESYLGWREGKDEGQESFYE